MHVSSPVCFFSQAEQTSTCANSVDPDETARHEPSHQDLQCLSFFFFRFLTETPVYISGQVQFQEWKCPLQKLRSERIKLWQACFRKQFYLTRLFSQYWMFQRSHKPQLEETYLPKDWANSGHTRPKAHFMVI